MNNSHDHNHHHDTQSALTIEQKMVKLLDHWVKHNNDHAQTYRDWAEKANRNKLLEVESLLNDAAEMTLQINEKFRAAIREVAKNT